ncbi:hypothetical protein [Palleronia abyssalis]|uniref:Uncharacterized protein n=1 Tax=Palleronia abyssalis TaxID=1501240 RepID=A0A2R8BU93_9RHOB|nr:hypothetical protein [Palleronia abyssalis]SPJ23722.1 hypothetical protein PAA8504_01537 [Palleronia abyssalis]
MTQRETPCFTGPTALLATLGLALFLALSPAHGGNEGPAYAKGDTLPPDTPLAAVFPGLDLPRLDKTEGYMRFDEYIYRAKRKTLIVLEVIEIGTVILW